MFILMYLRTPFAYTTSTSLAVYVYGLEQKPEKSKKKKYKIALNACCPLALFCFCWIATSLLMMLWSLCFVLQHTAPHLGRFVVGVGET